MIRQCATCARWTPGAVPEVAGLCSFLKRRTYRVGQPCRVSYTGTPSQNMPHWREKPAPPPKRKGRMLDL